MSRPPRFTLTLLFASSLAISPAALRAQASAVVDEGTFMITQQGAPYGRESFRIVRTPAPGGQVYRATGQGALGDYRVTSSLGADSAGVPVAYESELRLNGRIVQRLRGRGRPGRFTILSNTTSGEAAREYVLDTGALLLDGDVIHHYFFVPMVADRANLSVIAPRLGEQARYRLEELDGQSIDIGGRGIETRHFALSGNGVRREVWVDGRGRLLKVSIPDKGLVAVRDEPPR